jgi:chromosome segregation ATPase
MTTNLILIASLVGAVLFFVAGAALVALRHKDKPQQVGPSDTERAQAVEISRLRDALAGAEATVKSQASIIDEQNRLFERDVTSDRAGVARDMQTLRDRADRAEAAAREAKRAAETEATKLRAEADRLRAEVADLAKLRAEAADVTKLRAEADRLRAEVEKLTKEVQAATATNQALRKVADDRAKQLDRSRNESVAATTDMAQVEAKLRDIERQLAEKTATVRDLSTENENMKGRLRDADALRAEYVRLRTATTDSEYLKSEIARLEKELRRARVDALGARTAPARPRPARGTDRQNASRPISESLAMAIERFADADTRSSVLGDTQGFPLASCGSEGVALAAYAASLFESASRAKEYLPIGAPTAIELVDANGVHVSVWSLEVETEHLVFANLAVGAVDSKRVEATLGDLTQILAPSRPSEQAV